MSFASLGGVRTRLSPQGILTVALRRLTSPQICKFPSPADRLEWLTGPRLSPLRKCLPIVRASRAIAHSIPSRPAFLFPRSKLFRSRTIRNPQLCGFRFVERKQQCPDKVTALLLHDVCGLSKHPSMFFLKARYRRREVSHQANRSLSSIHIDSSSSDKNSQQSECRRFGRSSQLQDCRRG